MASTRNVCLIGQIRNRFLSPYSSLQFAVKEKQCYNTKGVVAVYPRQSSELFPRTARLLCPRRIVAGCLIPFSRRKFAQMIQLHHPDMKLSNGTVHIVPTDLRTMIHTNPRVHTVWEDITPLARNEWICWIEDAKKPETRARRIAVAKSKMLAGARRPCCWAGCPHR